MVCQTCGAQNLAQTAFCTTCGESSDSVASVASPQSRLAPRPLSRHAEVGEEYQPGQQLRESRLLAPVQPVATAPAIPAYGYLQPAYQAAPAASYQSLAQAPAQAYVIAGKFERWLANFIDVLFCLPLLLFAIIPLLGSIIVGITMPLYWLLRDIRGASLGKMMLGLRVVRLDGQATTSGALMLRNVLYAAPHLLHIIPYLGTFLMIFIFTPYNFLEGLLVLFTDRRIGDRLAGTIVVKAR